ncbi:zinc ribbon domain-containing protein [Methanocella sp. CWC-04]|uniref:Zinc ribbon domain-containing protein n=2 Tax=Methanooceanicella nereidis TaxID=2052831 RepID=A0AAP2W751_9EURY|nr:zinc ribbon domain-containing protein [Methanocella sp. CWC-04]
MAEIKCDKCGAQIKFEPGDRFARCKYCDTQVFIDRSGAGFFYIMPYLIDRSGAEGIFNGWARSSKVSKKLLPGIRNLTYKQQYFPVYMFKRDVSGEEKLYVQPARSTTLPGLHSLKVLAGDLKIFDKSYKVEGPDVLVPDIDMTAYLPFLPGTAKEQALVYFPLWDVEYEYDGKKYVTIIDGSSGEVFVSDYPVRSSAPFILITIGAFILFFLESLAGFFLFKNGLCCSSVLILPTIPAVILLANRTLRRF